MKLFKRIVFVSVSAMLAIGVGTGMALNQNSRTAKADAQLLNSFNFLDGGDSSNSAYANTDISTNVSYASDNPGGTSGTTAWEADYANLSMTTETRLGGKLVSTVQTDNTTAWANIKTTFTFGSAIEEVDIIGTATFGTAGNTTMLYLQSSTDSVTWTTQASTTTKSGDITFSGLSIPTSSYLRFGIALTASSKNSGIAFTGLKVYESVTVSKTLSSLSYSGTPTTASYQEGDDFLTDGITVTATYSDSSTDDVTAAVVWADLIEGDTSVVGTYTYSGASLTVTVTGLTVTAAPIIGSIVDGHTYLITGAQSATLGTTNYILKASNSSTTSFAAGASGDFTEIFTSAANYSASDGYVFTKVGTNEYQITSSTNYLSATATNNGLVLGTTSDSWIVTEASGTTGEITYNGVFLQDSSQNRYLTVYSPTPNFRTYTSTTSQPLPAACIVLYDMTAIEGFASSFNTACQGVCVSDGSTNVSSLSSVWSSQSTAFSNLLSKEQAVFADTTNAVGSESGTTIQQAISKYEYIAAKYNTQLMASGWEFMGRNISASSSANIGLGSTNSNVALLAIVAVSTLIILCGAFYIQKKKFAK